MNYSYTDLGYGIELIYCADGTSIFFQDEDYQFILNEIDNLKKYSKDNMEFEKRLDDLIENYFI